MYARVCLCVCGMSASVDRTHTSPLHTHSHTLPPSPPIQGGIDPWIYHNIGGLRPPSANVNAFGFGRGVGRVSAGHLDLGVEGVVARRVRACSASVRVRGGRASVSWAFENNTMVYNISVPLGYTAELRFPAKIKSDSGSDWMRAGPVNGYGGQRESQRDGQAVIVSLSSGRARMWMQFQ